MPHEFVSASADPASSTAHDTASFFSDSEPETATPTPTQAPANASPRRLNRARKSVPAPGRGKGTGKGKGKGKVFPTTGGGKVWPFGDGASGERISKTARAGLCFAVPRVYRNIKRGRYAERVTQTAVVYLTAVLEYLVAELIELSGDAAHQLARKRISPRHICLAARNDDELVQLLPGSVIFREGGFVPNSGCEPPEPMMLAVEGARSRKNRI